METLAYGLTQKSLIFMETLSYGKAQKSLIFLPYIFFKILNLHKTKKQT